MRRPASRVALCAVLTALSVVLLMAASALPSGRWAVAAAAGLAPAAAVVSAGLPAGALTWIAGAALGLLLAADKGVALLYLIFFGAYPIVKCIIERLRRMVPELICKLIYFNLTLTAVLFGLRSFFPFLTRAPWIYYAAGSALFLLYDYGFSKLIMLYTGRIDGRRKQI